MKLTAKARIAVTALADIAAYGGLGPVSLADIGSRHRMSVPFLEQTFGKLRKAGLVESRRGAGGGYVLAHPAKAITVASVVRAIDEEIRSTACRPGAAKGCTGTSAHCLTHGLWHDLDRMIEGYLEGVTLADIADGVKVVTDA
ncbi:RrF2 family transcriptional regulator [Parvularcula sp. LCG005]|uniref:Rrf2 family transcriptional regulator n=1 Tax=Parvularcula sp. LCG005 TaxID=3078805 RepID=UPI00294393D6|nr:RrF2 family transcriptional regulator [Parvularcula sp. LCG005]WOI54610.1 RrF2 family transcriptional regulator [Parvularcula sp. LCG005]